MIEFMEVRSSNIHIEIWGIKADAEASDMA
jgi:hypothetical protein